MIVLTWGAHQGIRGATWIRVFADGRVEREATDGTLEQLGSVSAARVADLDRAVQAVFETDTPRITNPGRLFSLHRGSEERQLPTDALELPSVAAVNQIFTGLCDEAAPRPEPIIVRPSSLYWGTMIVGGLMTCGLVFVVMWFVMRKLPGRMDDDGITTRGGRFLPWSELTLRHRVNAARPSEVLGYDLLHADGTEIRLAVGGLADGHTVVQYALDRMA